MRMELANKIPIIGGLIAALVLYGQVFWGFLRAPIQFVPDFTKKEDTRVADGVEILFAGLVVTYLILFPLLNSAGALAAQPIFLFFMMLRYMLVIPSIHFSFVIFRSSTSFRTSTIFWLIYLGITLPIGVLLQYPNFIAMGSENFLYGFSQFSSSVNKMSEFYATDARAPLFNMLFIVGMVIVFLLTIIVLFWIKRIYVLSWWRCIAATFVGVLIAFILDTVITQPLWKIIESYIVALAKIS